MRKSMFWFTLIVWGSFTQCFGVHPLLDEAFFYQQDNEGIRRIADVSVANTSGHLYDVHQQLQKDAHTAHSLWQENGGKGGVNVVTACLTVALQDGTYQEFHVTQGRSSVFDSGIERVSHQSFDQAPPNPETIFQNAEKYADPHYQAASLIAEARSAQENFLKLQERAQTQAAKAAEKLLRSSRVTPENPFIQDPDTLTPADYVTEYKNLDSLQKLGCADKERRQDCQTIARLFWHSEPRLVSSLLESPPAKFLDFLRKSDQISAVFLDYHSRLNTCDICRPTLMKAYPDIRAALQIPEDIPFKIVSSFSQPCPRQSPACKPNPCTECHSPRDAGHCTCHTITHVPFQASAEHVTQEYLRDSPQHLFVFKLPFSESVSAEGASSSQSN